MEIPWDEMGWDRHKLPWDGMGWNRKIGPMDKPGKSHRSRNASDNRRLYQHLTSFPIKKSSGSAILFQQRKKRLCQ